MPGATDVLITGIGIVSPIGVGNDAVWQSLETGRSGVRNLTLFDASQLPVRIAGEVTDFDPKPFVANRKSLKVMARDSQMGVAASALACQDAGIESGTVDPNRFGALLGADRIAGSMADSLEPYRRCIRDGRFDFRLWGSEGIPASFPLSFLRVLPNMIASHVSIAHDARGPSNTIHQMEVSGLLAVAEAARIIQRGRADIMIAGAASSRMTPYDWIYHCLAGRLSAAEGDPSSVLRPFAADRTGEVYGEGAAALILESRRHAEARSAKVYGRILGASSAFQPGNGPSAPAGLIRAINQALAESGVASDDLGHISAHGAGTPDDDLLEARALACAAPRVPVTAPKSYFGNLGAAGGAIELAVSLLGLGRDRIPPTLNYSRPDPQCRLPVIHANPLWGSKPAALAVNFTPIGQAVAMVVARQ